MTDYQPNSARNDSRYSTRGLMGPAVLVTLGLLFLLANMADYPIERTWPILLIVIGAIKVVRYVFPDSGQLNPVPYPPASYQATPVSSPVVTPPPAPIAGALGDGGDENGEVHNG
jgi:Domain of unknown function (DUF5668)